MEVIDCMYVT